MIQMFIMLLSPVAVVLFIFALIYPESYHDWCFFKNVYLITAPYNHLA